MFRVQQAVRRGDAAPLVGPVVAPVVDEHGLRVLGIRVIELAIAGLDDFPDLVVVEGWATTLLGELVHPVDEVRQVVLDYKVGAVFLEILHGDGPLGTQDALRQELPVALVPEVGVLFRAGEGKLPGDDGLVEDEPGVVVSRAAYVFERR